MEAILAVLWGLKTYAIFDVWTFEHILSGISVGCAVRKKNHKEFKKFVGDDHKCHSWHFDMLGVLFIAFAWEALEHYLEIGLAGQSVEFWFQGVEYWQNRLWADPLMMVAGYMLAKRWSFLVVPARFLSIIWLLTHVFVFPHSMYLHNFL